MHAVKYDNFYVIITLISFRNKITYKIMRIFINNSPFVPFLVGKEQFQNLN